MNYTTLKMTFHKQEDLFKNHPDNTDLKLLIDNKLNELQSNYVPMERFTNVPREKAPTKK